METHNDMKAHHHRHSIIRGRDLFRIGCFGIIALFALFLLFCVFYTVKSAFGLDFFPTMHLKDMINSILD